MLEVGTYRTVNGELFHYRLDAAGKSCCEIESADGLAARGLRDVRR